MGKDVAMLLANDLRAGVFAPGAWLKQVDLQQRYGVGRAPIRKALERLAERRLIRHEINRGYSVHPADNQETEQIVAIRVAIESGFADAICAGARANDIEALSDLAKEFCTVAEQGPFERLYDVNLAFHRRMLRCSGNEPMVNLIDDLRLRTSPAPASQWHDRARVTRSGEEHLLMVDAIRKRDAAALASLIRQHILQ